MSLESSENVESDPFDLLSQSAKERCLLLVDKDGKSLDSTKKLKVEVSPNLAIVYATSEDAENPNAGGQNCVRFMEWATTLLSLRDERRKFPYGGDPSLLAEDLSFYSMVLENLEPIHIEKLALAYESSYELKKHVGLAFARRQIPQLGDEAYEYFYPKVKLPQPGTSARMILDRVKLMRSLDIIGYGDQNADHVLYTGGDFPVPFAYNKMEALASGGRIEIIKPYQLVYGLQTGALVRATSERREERYPDICNYFKNWMELSGSMWRASRSQDFFYFKSRT